MFAGLLIIHLIGAAAAAGVWFVAAGFRLRARRMPDDIAGPLMAIATGSAAWISAVALVLLWGTGAAMLVLIDGLAETGGLWFAGKIALVILVTVLNIPIHVLNARVRRGADIHGAAIARDRYSHMVLVLGIAILTLAVLAFR